MTLTEMLAKRDALVEDQRKVFAEALIPDGDDKGKYDYGRVKCLGEKDGGVKFNTLEISEKVGEKTAEIAEIAESIEAEQKLATAAKELKAYKDDPVKLMTHPGASLDASLAERKSFARMVTDSPVFKSWAGGNIAGTISVPEYGLRDLKTLFQTTAGWEPESTRTGLVVDAVTRPLQVLDIIPSARTAQTSIVYMLETTRTSNAAEMAEAGTYAEDAYVLTQKDSPVRKIGTSIPVTDEQLTDVAMVESYLNGRLQFGIRQRLDSQVIVGDGTGVNLTGITNTAGIQTQALSAEPVPDTIYKALDLVRITGRAVPNAVMMHPTNWQAIRLLRTSDGVYIWGSPSETGIPRLWGLPVVQPESLTVGTALVGDFANFCSLFELRGIELKMGFNSTDFITGKQTMRADLRTAFVVTRPTAFSTATGL